MRTIVERDLYAATSTMIEIRLDANGQQSVKFSLSGGCNRSVIETRSENTYLENGYNRVELSGSFETDHPCATISLRAESGPVSLVIEDAKLIWEP